MVKILVVDDDQDMQGNIVEILSDANFEVHSVSNGEEALSAAKETAFDLILLDLIMPGMGGMDVLPFLKKESPSTKVIMITAFSTIDNAVEAMRKGADDYITKPFKINELLNAVRKSLEEAKFIECQTILNMDETFNSLANSIRREILLLINQHGKLRFMDITRKLGIEDHTKVNFHLKVLKEADLIIQEGKKFYVLSPGGEKVITCIKAFAKGL